MAVSYFVRMRAVEGQEQSVRDVLLPNMERIPAGNGETSPARCTARGRTLASSGCTKPGPMTKPSRLTSPARTSRRTRNACGRWSRASPSPS